VRIHAIVAAVLVVGPPVAPDAWGQQPRAHHHGSARLQVSVDGPTLQVAFEGPADNILGFEQAPRTDAQKKTVARAEEQLKQTPQLFGTPAEAGCQPQPARVEMKLPPAGSKETHSEIEAEWRWVCANPGGLTFVDVLLFKAFPRLKQLQAQVVTGRGQAKAVLKPGGARVKIGS
jgi:hypothetical protein